MKIQRVAVAALFFPAFQFTSLYTKAQTGAPVVAFAYLKSERFGEIKGNTTAKGFEGDVSILYVQYNENAQKPEKGQLIIRKNPDAASEKLQTVFSSHSGLSEVMVKMVKIIKGEPKVYQTYRLTNSFIMDIKYVDAVEQITLGFQKMEIYFPAN